MGNYKHGLWNFGINVHVSFPHRYDWPIVGRNWNRVGPERRVDHRGGLLVVVVRFNSLSSLLLTFADEVSSQASDYRGTLI
jgi:hypothetical protein